MFPKADGYRGIWYFCNGLDGPLKYKYSGGLGTYCAKHIPMACYSAEAKKTFFCYGGRSKDSNTLVHMVSYYDHETHCVPRPTVLLDKQTSDAHDNPVLMLDGEGYVWVFSSAHGTARTAYIHRSSSPFHVDDFECVSEFNYSYPQPWWLEGQGFCFLHTRYVHVHKGHPNRTLQCMTSPDGRTWTEPTCLANIELGHYQISWPRQGVVTTALNMHPGPVGLDSRTNLYCLQSRDFGRTWQSLDGQSPELPLQAKDNPALVLELESKQRNVYLKDLNYDAAGNAVILTVTSGGPHPGPQNDPRVWTLAHWTGDQWRVRTCFESDSNYDTGCLHIEPDGTWRIIAPTDNGPQPWNPGGEMVMWTSGDEGQNWSRTQLTDSSEYNHTYARRPRNAHDGFYALWADGHGLEESPSRLYFCTRAGRVFRLPYDMESDQAEPEELPLPSGSG